MVGEERLYNNSGFPDREDVVLWDIFPISDGEKIKLVCEEINSEYTQGVWLMCDVGLEFDGKRIKSGDFWFEQLPSEYEIRCFSKNGLLSVYNIFFIRDSVENGRRSQTHTSGMLVEDIPNGRRYFCNDVGYETNFDKLIFRIERIPNE